jgi:acetolactate synthase-1/2/3 large subunit
VIKVSDYIARRIAELGVKHVFLVTGGGAMHLDDSLGRRPELTLVCNHHEQACAIAAEGYARIGEAIGVTVVTTGPGGTNTITGVLGQWHDSVPALYVSGQVRFDTTVASTQVPLRQLGDQEASIIELVRPITKYAEMVVDPRSVRYHFEKAVYLARSGRPGPVWLDVPLDVQAAQVDEASLPGFNPAVEPMARGRDDVDPARVRRQVADLVERLRGAERPVLLGGGGVRAAGAAADFRTLAERLGIPVVTAWNAHDLMYEDHPLYVGRPGTIGDRAGNFAVQNADLLISVGCRLNVRQIGYEFKAFARHAYKAIVDIDAAELRKPTIAPDMPIHSDARIFCVELGAALDAAGWQAIGGRAAERATTSAATTDRLTSAAGGAARGDPALADWLAWCLERKLRYPVVLPEYRAERGAVNAYVFVDVLSEHLEHGDVVVCANGAACVVAFQALRLKDGQRLLANSGTAGMGYDLPAAIGAAFACGGRVVCLAGDGSIQMNLQELQTIVHHHLPIKIFIFNNGGYLSIRQTQDNLFAGHRVGEGPATGVSFPDMVAIAGAYGIEATRVRSHDTLDEAIGATLESPGPALCDVVMPTEAVFAPKVAAARRPDGRIVSKPLEDMTPFLERDEFAENMLIPEWEAE